MKKIIVCILILFPVISFAQIVSGELTYKAVYLEEKQAKSIENIKAKAPGMMTDEMLQGAMQPILKANTFLSYINYSLKFNKKEALFSQQQYMDVDANSGMEMLSGLLGYTGDYYTNLNKDKSIHSFDYLDKLWLVEDDIIVHDWELKPETKVIQGYTCNKAVLTLNRPVQGSSQIVAWYAPELPFAFGPGEYGGLPGLILELERGSYKVYANKIKFDARERSICIPTKGEKHNRDTYETKRYETINKLRPNR